MIVNRTLRDKLAEGLRAFMRREIDSYDFDDIVLDTCSWLDQDANLVSNHLWLFYDDLKIHHISVSKEGWEYLKRWYAFLKTDYSLEERNFSLGWWYLPWILLSIFLCAGLIAYLPVLLLLWPPFGVILYVSYRRRLDKDEHFIEFNHEYVRLSRFAPFISEEDWQRHESLAGSAEIPPYDPSVHAKPYRSPAKEFAPNLMTLIGFVLLFPLAAVLFPLLRESKCKVYLRTD